MHQNGNGCHLWVVHLRMALFFIISYFYKFSATGKCRSHNEERKTREHVKDVSGSDGLWGASGGNGEAPSRAPPASPVPQGAPLWTIPRAGAPDSAQGDSCACGTNVPHRGRRRAASAGPALLFRPGAGPARWAPCPHGTEPIS